MKRAALTLLALSLIAGSAMTLADGRHGRDHRHDRRDHPAWEHRRHHDSPRWHGHRGYDHHHRFHAPRYHPPRGYKHYHWRRGDRLPRAYYARPYIIHDYHVYHLHRPPHGYHWVRVNRDVLLTAIATGVVLDVIYNHFY